MREVWQRRLMALLWAIGLSRVFIDHFILDYTALAALAIYLFLAIAVSNRLNLIVAALVGSVAITIAALERQWSALLDGFIFSLLFTAFLPTLQLIRTSLDVGPEVSQSRDIFAKMPESQRSNALLVGSNVLGSVMTLGTLSMLAPLLPKGADLATRSEAAQWILRGLTLAIPWSPFSVGMAIALVYWPSIQLWQVLGSGLIMAFLGITISNLMSAHSGGWGGTLQALNGFRPLLIPLGGTMLTVVILTGVTPFGTLQTIVVFMPLLCLLWILCKNHREWFRVARTTYRSLNRFGGELLLFCSAVTLGQVLQQSNFLTEVFNQPAIAELPIPLVIAGIMTIGFLLAMAGFHSVVIGACVLVLLSPFSDRIADIVAVQILLFCWSCGALLSLSALSIVVASNLFQVTIPKLIFSRNIVFMLVYGCCLCAVFSALNFVLLMP